MPFSWADRAAGQAADGHLVGIVLDQTGASIPGSTVRAENDATGNFWFGETDALGAYRFNNLPVGSYTVSVEADGFSPRVLSDIVIALNRSNTVNVTLELGGVETEIQVTAATAQIDTTSSNISGSFDARQALYSPSTDIALGVLNLALQGAGVASSGGTGLGEGPSVGGQRPRNNSFMVEGVDNNDKGVTGRVVDVPNEAVAEFSQQQNQFSAEFGRSTGGQFNTVVRSGTNDIHGSLYEYFANRHLNAIDESNKRRGITENPRLDDNRFGGAVGGPVIRNRLFYFGNYQRNPVGVAAAPGRPFSAPTAEGFAALDRVQGISQTNLDVLKRFVPAAPEAQRSTTVLGTEVPIGVLPINVPAWQNNASMLASADYTREAGDQLRFRFIRNSTVAIDPGTVPDLPTFTTRERGLPPSGFGIVLPHALAGLVQREPARLHPIGLQPAGRRLRVPGSGLVSEHLDRAGSRHPDRAAGQRTPVGSPEHLPGRPEPDLPAGSQHPEVRRRRPPQHHFGGLHPEAAGRLQLLDAGALPSGSEPRHPGGAQHRGDRLQREQHRVLRVLH